MLDIDYNHNRMVVCGYQAHILRTVGNMILKKPQIQNKKFNGSNRRSIDKINSMNSRASPTKASTLVGSGSTVQNLVEYDPHQLIESLITNCQNPRLFFTFDKDNAEKMFGYRVRYIGPEDDENEDICYAYRHIP